LHSPTLQDHFQPFFIHSTPFFVWHFQQWCHYIELFFLSSSKLLFLATIIETDVVAMLFCRKKRQKEEGGKKKAKEK
jgi:hypothetical protein